jgi:hypothetical protein
MVNPKIHNLVTNKYECSSLSRAMNFVVHEKIIHWVIDSIPVNGGAECCQNSGLPTLCLLAGKLRLTALL